MKKKTPGPPPRGGGSSLSRNKGKETGGWCGRFRKATRRKGKVGKTETKAHFVRRGISLANVHKSG